MGTFLVAKITAGLKEISLNILKSIITKEVNILQMAGKHPLFVNKNGVSLKLWLNPDSIFLGKDHPVLLRVSIAIMKL